MQKVQRLFTLLNKAVSTPVVQSGAQAGLSVRSDVRAGKGLKQIAAEQMRKIQIP